jgi:cytochrome P450
LIAAHETTSITLTWTWILLSQNEEAATKLEAEIRALGSDKLSFGDLCKLPFASQVLKESLRLYPPNRSIAREVAEPFQIRDFNVPKGSQIVMSQWVLHRDSRYFTSPETFIPERWTPEFEQTLPKHAYFPFGLSNRLCIGKSFATMEITLILAVIAQKFRFTLDSPEEVEPHPVILLRPKNKLDITVKNLV